MLVATIILLTLAYVGYLKLFQESGHSVNVSISLVEGEVTHTRASGEKLEAQATESLEATDTLSVAQDSRAEIAIEGGSTLTLAELSSIRLLSVDDRGVQFELDDGQVTARIRPGSPPVSVTANDSTTTAENADFVVASRSDDVVGLEVTRGDARVQRQDAMTLVAQGQRLTLSRDEQPIITAIPTALLLEVLWPEADVQGTEFLVQGHTAPFATVTIRGPDQQKRVVADSHGKFQTKILMNDGDNPLSVVAVDPLGNEMGVNHVVRRDSTPPSIHSEVVWE